MRALRREHFRQMQFDREQLLDHDVARALAKRVRNLGGEVHDQRESQDSKYYSNVSYRFCGVLAIWVGYAVDSNVYEARIEGYPSVSDISMNVRNPSSTKTLTRAARYALVFLEQQLGAPVYGAVKLDDGETYDVRVAPVSRG